MSRFYDIQLSLPNVAAGSKPALEFTSHPGGVFDPNAQLVEIDAPVAASGEPLDTGALVRIHGIPLSLISQSQNLNKYAIKVFGGMQKGLPLANPAQAGPLVQGIVFQAFGNWIGTNMDLDLVILGGTGSAFDPANLVLSWQKGQQLSDALKSCLSIAYPNKNPPTINISQNLIISETQNHVAQSLAQLSQYLGPVTRQIIGAGYPGISIFIKGNSIIVSDGTVPPNPKQLAFTDLIGQPTWTGPATIQATCVMRGDISVNDYIKFPPGQVTITEASLSQFRQGSVFQGIFRVISQRHIGNSRQPNAESWITILECLPVPKRKGTVEITDLQTGGTIQSLSSRG